MMTKIIRILKAFIGPFLLAVAIWVLHGELKTFHFQDALRSLHELPNQSILLCFLLTVLSYLIMSGYDLLALRYIRHPLSYPKIGVASFIGYAFSNNIGLSMLAGGSVRYRLYSSWGLSALEITEVVGFCTLSLWLGFFTLGGVSISSGADACSQSPPCSVLFSQICGNPFPSLGLHIYLLKSTEKKALQDKGMGILFAISEALGSADFGRRVRLGPRRDHSFRPAPGIRQSVMALVYQRVLCLAN